MGGEHLCNGRLCRTVQLSVKTSREKLPLLLLLLSVWNNQVLNLTSELTVSATIVLELSTGELAKTGTETPKDQSW